MCDDKHGSTLNTAELLPNRCDNHHFHARRPDRARDKGPRTRPSFIPPGGSGSMCDVQSRIIPFLETSDRLLEAVDFISTFHGDWSINRSSGAADELRRSHELLESERTK